MLRPGPAVWKTSPWAQQAWKQGWSPIHLKSLHLNAYANVEVGKQANQNLSPHLTTFFSAIAFELDLAQSQLCSYRCVPFPGHWKVFLKHILMEEAGHPFIQTPICSGSTPTHTHTSHPRKDTRVHSKKQIFIILNSESLSCMCMIFARTQTCCSAGTQSQSSPSQSSPREPFPPPPKHRSCQGQRTHRRMEPRPGHSLRPEDGGVGKEQTYKPLHVLSRGLQSKASYCFNGLSRPAPSIAASFYAMSSRQARPLPGIKFHCKQSPSSPSPRQGPSGAPRCSSAPVTPPALLEDGEIAIPKSEREDTGWQPQS